MGGKFAPGDRVAFSAGFMNQLVDLTSARGRDFSTILSGNDYPTIIKVKNISGEAKEYNSVMGLGDLLYEDGGEVAEDMLMRFRKGQISLEAKAVVLDPENENHTTSFCVLKSSLKNNQIGDAYIGGVVTAQVKVLLNEDHYRFAMPTDGEDYLTISPAGIFEIIWKEDGFGEYPKWAFVRVCGGCCVPPLYEATEDEDEGEILAKRVISDARLTGENELFVVVPDDPPE